MSRRFSGRVIGPGFFAATACGLALALPAPGLAGSGVTISVTVQQVSGGSGSVTGPGIDCPGDCQETVPADTPVSLVGTPAAGSSFAWGGDCEGFNPDEPCQLNGSADTFVTAVFTGGGGGGGGGPGAPPEAQITKAPKKVKTQKKKGKATFEFDGAGAAGFECRLDEKPFKGCTSPARVKAKIGRHTFEVRALDATGAPGPAASHSFKVKKKK